ncbi:hypothetical protein BDV96DRAFT_628938 [Lophiotrema nucula]|uniref:Uncharacterized protein n=1 Tax=Lophiotrema nucula TaxID=690887 RepID=A0A6A5ZLH8_9PLEO|nr:hypothetical protein BDV96DRAFT_628938 [Lophiotrema nucula]
MPSSIFTPKGRVKREHLPELLLLLSTLPKDMPVYIPKRSFCGCVRHPAIPEFSDAAKDALCPPCRILESINHLDWLHEQFKKRGGIFQSKNDAGHQDLKKAWVKTKVVVAKHVGHYEGLAEAEEKWNTEKVAELNDLEKSGGVIAALIKWREYEKDQRHVAGVQSEEESVMPTNNEDGPVHSVIFPQFRPNSIERPVTPQRKDSATSLQTLPSSVSTSSLKPARKSGNNSPKTPSKRIRINDIVMVSPEHLNHTHFEAPILSRSPTQQPHNKHVDAEHKTRRGRLIRIGPANIKQDGYWASPEEHEKVDTSSFKVQWAVVEEQEKKAVFYNKIAGAWILLWYLARVWELLDWRKLSKEYKKRIRDPVTRREEEREKDEGKDEAGKEDEDNSHDTLQ